MLGTFFIRVALFSRTLLQNTLESAARFFREYECWWVLVCCGAFLPFPLPAQLSPTPKDLSGCGQGDVIVECFLIRSVLLFTILYAVISYGVHGALGVVR